MNIPADKLKTFQDAISARKRGPLGRRIGKGKGSLRVAGKDKPYWMGEWHQKVFDNHGIAHFRHRAENLGFCSEVPEQAARDLLVKLVRNESLPVPTTHPMLERSLNTAMRNGAAAEMLASADLLQNGYEVFKSLNPGSPFDLVAFRDGHFLRVEVKMTELSKDGYPRCDLTTKAGAFDLLVVITPSGKAIYKTYAEAIRPERPNHSVPQEPKS